MAGPKVVVFDNRKLRKKHAVAPQVQVKVHEVTERIAGTAQALFEPHDRPGGHHILTEYHLPDGLVILEGPAPVALDQGHFTDARIDSERRFVKGIHVLTRALDGA